MRYIDLHLLRISLNTEGNFGMSELSLYVILLDFDSVQIGIEVLVPLFMEERVREELIYISVANRHLPQFLYCRKMPTRHYQAWPV